MKTHQTAPACSLEEFLRIDRDAVSYGDPISYEFTRALALAYLERLRADYGRFGEDELRALALGFLPRFLFDCGRIYGIRQERERRRGTGAGR